MTLEYRESRKYNKNSFFNQRCPRCRRRGFVAERNKFQDKHNFPFLQARAGTHHAHWGRGLPGLICHHLSVQATAPLSSGPGAIHGLGYTPRDRTIVTVWDRSHARLLRLKLEKRVREEF